MQGYIKLFRRLVDWEWYSDINVCRLFLHCLLKANYIDKSWQGIVIKAGSFITSYEKLSIETGLTIQQVRTALDKLKLTGEITNKTTSRYSMITVNNWINYQEDNKQTNKQITNEQQTNNKQITTTNNIKNIKNNKNINIIPTKTEIIEYANRQLGKNIDVDSFIAYYNASDWQDDNGFFINWKRKIVTWANNYKAKDTETFDRDAMFQRLEDEARKAGKL